jgi:PAS domain S-box-containing protein
MPDIIPFDNLYREIIDHSAEGIVVYDKALRCVLWNQRMAEITGVAARDVINRDQLEVFPFLRTREEAIKRLMQRVLNGETATVPDEEIHIPQTGKRFWVSGIVAPHRDKQGNIIGMVALYRDITDRKHSENALRESEARYRRMLETAYEAVWTADTKNIVSYANARMTEMTGYDLHEIIGKEAFSFVFPDDVAASKERVAACIAGAREPFDFRLRRKDGSAQWVRSTATPIIDDKGVYQGMLGMMTDIGEAKIAQETLQNTVSELANLYNNAPCGYHSLDERGVFVKINDTELGWIGYNRDEVIGKMRITDILTDKSRELFNKSFPYFVRDDGSVREIEYEIRRRDGSVFLVLAKSKAVFDANRKFLRTHSSLFDVTESREAEKTMLASEMRYRQMFEHHRSVQLLVDPSSGEIVDANPAAAAFYGYPLPVLKSMGMHQINAMPQDELIAEMKRARAAEKTQFIFKHRLASGEARDVEIHAGPVDIGGRQLIYSIVRDITEQKLTEIKLSQSEARYRTLVNNTTDIIYETDAQGHFMYFNTEATRRLLQYSEAELIGEHFRMVIHPEWRERVENFYRMQFLSKSPTSYLEFPVVVKDGTVFWLGQSVHMVIEKGRVIKNQAFCRDITERRKREEELELSQKKLQEFSSRLQKAREAERSRIAREIHDELGASLTTLKMDLSWHTDSLIKSHHPLAAKLTEIISKVDESIQTVRKIATDLRPSILDNLGLWAAIEWQAQELKSRLRIPCKLSMNVPDAPLHPDEATAIFRIVQESLTNVARHANATLVTIDVDATESDVCIKISDNGKGMARSALKNSQSLGILGMHERAKSFGGEFSIESTPNNGTSVSLRMPIRLATISTERAAQYHVHN